MCRFPPERLKGIQQLDDVHCYGHDLADLGKFAGTKDLVLSGNMLKTDVFVAVKR